MTEKNESVVLVGKKPIKAYILASVLALSKTPKLVLKARGKLITKAVDLAEILKRTENVKVEAINFGSETVSTKDNRQKTVSTIEIILVK